MREKFDILVTDSRYKHALSIVRSLGSEGLRIATCSEGFSPTRFSKYSKRSFSYTQENFEKKLLKFLKQNEVILVLPVGYYANLACSKIKKKIKQYSEVILDEYGKVSKVSDKEKIIPLAQKGGLNMPKTQVVRTSKDLTKIKGEKYIVKSAMEENGEKVSYVNSREELSEVVLGRLQRGTQIIQEIVRGQGRGFFAFCERGEVLQSFQHERVRQFPESGGVSSCAKSIYDKKLDKISRKFLKSILWTGPVMLEFIYNNKKKKYYFIEMNAKFWGSYDLSVSCGLNFAKIPFDIVNRNEIHEKDYLLNKKFQWVLPEDTLRIRTSKNRRVAAAVWRKDLMNNLVDKDIQYIFNDPLPTIIRILSTSWRYFFEK